MADKLLITGGTLRPNGYELGEGKYYGCAKLLELDTATRRSTPLLSIAEGNDCYPDEHPNLEFTASAIDGDRLWLSTDTEIRQYRYPSLELLSRYSHPCFHNVHSVAVRDDELYVTSTGLDLVVVLDKGTGAIRRLQNAEDKPVWHRFSEEVDYRKIHSTRPHACHPNYVFWVDDEPWVTRCRQEDAVQLADMSRRIDISCDKRPISVHDGNWYRDRLLFTLVDGTIVVVDPRPGGGRETVDLSQLKGFGGLRGWCRGLLVDGDVVYVGFSRLRKTRRMEKLGWIGRVVRAGTPFDCASILAVDLRAPRILEDYRLPSGALDALYSLLPTPTLAGSA